MYLKANVVVWVHTVGCDAKHDDIHAGDVELKVGELSTPGRRVEYRLATPL